MSDVLAQTARETLGLDHLAGDETALALLPTVQAALGPAIAALGELDTSAVPGEPDLDPGRAPREPIT